MGISLSIVSTFTRSLLGRLPACVRDLAISWHKDLNNTIDEGDTYDYVKDSIGTRTDDVYYGQYLDVTSGQINFYRTSGTFDYTDPSDGTLVEGVTIPGTGLYTVPANGICDIGVMPKTITNGVVGLLDFDGSSYVSIPTGTALTASGAGTTTFNLYIKSIPTAEEIIFGFFPNNDGIGVYLNNDGYLYAKTVMLDTTGTRRRYNISSLLNTELEIEITKTTQNVTNITINGIENSEVTTNTFSYGTAVNRIGANGSGVYGLSVAYVWNINVHNNAAYLGQPNGIDDDAWVDNTGVLDGVVTSSSENININPDNNSVIYTSFYPIAERAGTVLHDVMEDSIHISVDTPVWSESLYGSDYLNQQGFVDKADFTAAGYDWETDVFGTPTTLNDNTLVPLAQWEYVDLQDNTGENILDNTGEQIQVKVNI